MIHDISPSGTVRLATLDGEHMLNWMSSCRMKKYHAELTPDMLKRINATKEHQECTNKIKKEALEESRKRAKKHKNQAIKINTKIPRICQLNSDSDDDSGILRPYI